MRRPEKERGPRRADSAAPGWVSKAIMQHPVHMLMLSILSKSLFTACPLREVAPGIATISPDRFGFSVSVYHRDTKDAWKNFARRR
jgi:hypothetical protein